MPDLVGGYRYRMIRDSLYNCLKDSLADLGWFDDGRPHGPIHFPGRQYHNDEEIPVNTLVLADEDMYEIPVELGSNMVETAWQFYVDFYAESDSLGRIMAHDVRDILAGRMPAIGRTYPHVQVYDYGVATPNPVFFVDIDGIVVDRGRSMPKPWLKHWYTVGFEVIDAYGGE